MSGIIKFQIGKAGITDGIIESLNNAFMTHKVIRISLLKGSNRNKDSKKKIAEEIVEKLNGKFKYSIIGFTIVMKRIGVAIKKR